MRLDLALELLALPMLDEQNDYQYYKMLPRCRILPRPLNPKYQLSEHLRDPHLCYQEKCQLLHLREPPQTLIVSLTVLVFRMLQMQAITLLVLQQGPYNLECRNPLRHLGYPHQN